MPSEAIKYVRAAREPRLQMLYEVTPKVLEMAARTYPKDATAAVNLVSQFGYDHAVGYPQWWTDIIGYKPLVR